MAKIYDFNAHLGKLDEEEIQLDPNYKFTVNDLIDWVCGVTVFGDDNYDEIINTAKALFKTTGIADSVDRFALDSIIQHMRHLKEHPEDKERTIAKLEILVDGLDG